MSLNLYPSPQVGQGARKGFMKDQGLPWQVEREQAVLLPASTTLQVMHQQHTWSLQVMQQRHSKGSYIASFCLDLY